MKNFREVKVSVALGIAIICLFSVIYLSISYYLIDNALRKYGPGYERIYVIR